MWVLSSGRYTEDHPKGVGVGTGMGLAKVDAGATAVAAAVDWAREMEGAKMLMASGLLPQAIKRPEQALFVILAGRDLGLSPVQSLRSINVVQGKVELAADMQLSLFHRAGGKSKWEALTNDRAALWLNAPWLEAPHVETFTMEDAKRTGLTGDNWRKYPKAMLRSRAITAGLKSIGFDVLAGHYAEGELGGPEPVIVEEAPTILGGEVVDSRTIAPNWGMAGKRLRWSGRSPRRPRQWRRSSPKRSWPTMTRPTRSGWPARSWRPSCRPSRRTCSGGYGTN
jgi:hypothetical protein